METPAALNRQGKPRNIETKHPKSNVSNKKLKTLGITNKANTDKLNHEAVKLNILNLTFQTKNFQNTLGNTKKANADEPNQETAN